MEEFTDKVIIERSKLEAMESELEKYRKNSYMQELKTLRKNEEFYKNKISEYNYRLDWIEKETAKIYLKDNRMKELESENYDLKVQITSLEKYIAVKEDALTCCQKELEDCKNMLSSNRKEAVEDAARIKELENQNKNILYENKLLRKYRFHFWKRFKNN